MKEQIDTLLAPLSATLPLDHAMTELVPLRRQKPETLAIADQIAQGLGDRACLQAGLWLYVDDLDRSHLISQELHSIEGALWHAVMHRREGDFGNSKYWLREAGDIQILESVYGNPFDFVDQVQHEHRHNPAKLVDLQRKEWMALFAHCLANQPREAAE
jgi:hypothetical protein